MALTVFETFSRVLLGWLGRLLTKDSIGLRNDLVKARIPLLAEDYMASSIMQVIATFVGGVLFVLFLLGFLIPQIEMMENPSTGENFSVSKTVQYAIIGILVFALPALVGLIQLFTPGWVASSRATNMDRQIPYAASYVSALAAANATPSQTFKSLARNKDIYGEISNDAAWIFHSMEFMGRDLVTTLKEAVDRTPSERFAEFLQGIIGTVTSGGNLKLYFLNRYEYYAQQNRVHVTGINALLILVAFLVGQL